VCYGSRCAIKILQTKDSLEFSKNAVPLLLENEAENCLILGICKRLQDNPNAYPDATFWIIQNENEVVGAAWITPPHPLGLTRMPPEALPHLISDVLERTEKPSGIIGPKSVGDKFSQAWRKTTRAHLSLAEEQRIYRLDRVTGGSKAEGSMRLATENDLDLLHKWDAQFIADCGLNGNSTETATRAIAAKNRYLWEVDGQPKSMAGFTGPTPSGIRVNFVYTPKELRGKGYASAVVSALSQKLLDEGKKFCFLYTDLANPTSNSIYQKIGYRPVSDSIHHHFTY
jgi:uncharacterized protein